MINEMDPHPHSAPSLSSLQASLSASRPKSSSVRMDDCSLCKMVAGILKTYVDNNKTEVWDLPPAVIMLCVKETVCSVCMCYGHTVYINA